MGQKYQPLSTESKRHVRFEEDYSDLESIESALATYEEQGDSSYCSKVANFLSSKWLCLFNGTLLTTSLSILALVANTKPGTTDCVTQNSAWSPATASVSYNPVKYNVTTKGNQYVGAGPEVDRAWRAISYDMGDQWLSKNNMAKLDMPLSSLQVDNPSTGEQGYRVGIEVFHQLHCLNLLRRVTYRDYYEPLGGEFADGAEKLQKHTDHCIEVLRLNLQCNADVGLFTFYMIEGDPLAWPQLNSKHVCRDFDAVKAWATDHSVGNMELLE